MATPDLTTLDENALAEWLLGRRWFGSKAEEVSHVGVLDGRAVAAVLTFRLLTYWLPIFPGYLSLRDLRRAHLL